MKKPKGRRSYWGFHRSSIYNWLSRYEEGGYDELKIRHLPGGNRIMNENLEEKLLGIVTKRSPEDYALESALWAFRQAAGLRNEGRPDSEKARAVSLSLAARQPTKSIENGVLENTDLLRIKAMINSWAKKPATLSTWGKVDFPARA